ncbi:hypothetical protein WJX81_003928 [Elliptochloris bilobata]|uniref:Uncharacterized protein n=1 Tax=Elliptochloris bilobata TaxID=381761 RepID=A0AAW1RTJ2_9CHLO
MWSNFVITLVGVGAVAYLVRGDVRTGASTLRRNLKVIRGWLEEQGSAAQQASKQDVKQVGERAAPGVKPPEKEPPVPP